MSGQRLALTIGINDYPGTGSDLTGCVNDAMAWTAELGIARSFEVDVLTDARATRAAILGGIANLVEQCQWGDIAVVTFSGHGTWTPDLDGDEPDRRDEALVPYDAHTAGVISDDELHDLFARRAHGARIVMLSDSCHSGTVTRLAGPVDADRPRAKFLPPAAWMPPAELFRARALAGVHPRGTSRPTALLMSGCADPEYSYDGFGGQKIGAFTHVALETLGRLPAGATYRQWHAAIREHLPAVDVPQTPQLYGTRTQLAWPVFEAIDPRAGS